MAELVVVAVVHGSEAAVEQDDEVAAVAFPGAALTSVALPAVAAGLRPLCWEVLRVAVGV